MPIFGLSNRKSAFISAGLALLVVAGIAVVLFFVFRKKREGWEFSGPAGLLMNEGDDTATKHRHFLYKKCRAGMGLGDIMDNDEWNWMSKYNAEDAKNVCFYGQDTLGKVDVNEANDAAKAVGCANGPCPDGVLVRTRPCVNKTRDKCCVKGVGNKLTNCTPLNASSEAGTNKFRGWCIMQGSGGGNDVGKIEADTEGDATWQCNSWISVCGNNPDKCRASSFRCTKGSRLGDGNKCWNWKDGVATECVGCKEYIGWRYGG